MSSPKSQTPHLCGFVALPNNAHKPSLESQLCAAISASKDKKIDKVTEVLFAARDLLWDNGEILKYSFFGGTRNQHAKVDEVIQTWTWYANIAFKRVADDSSEATLRITFDPSRGSWSYIGNEAALCVGPDPTMNLGWITDTNTVTKEDRGIILHQFGHALGLMHEHMRPARSGAIRLKENEVLEYYRATQNWDEDTVRKQVLDVYSKNTVSNYGQLDTTSIMTYFIPASMNEGGVDIPQNTELSMFDKSFAVANYPRLQPHPSAAQWTPQFAFTVAGISSDATEAILSRSDVAARRKLFATTIALQMVLTALSGLGYHPLQYVPSPNEQRFLEPMMERLADMIVKHSSLSFAVDTAVSTAVAKLTVGVANHADLKHQQRLAAMRNINVFA